MEEKFWDILEAVVGSFIGVIILLLPTGCVNLLFYYGFAEACDPFRETCVIYLGGGPILYLLLIILSIIIGPWMGQKYYGSKHPNSLAIEDGIVGGAMSIILSSVVVFAFMWIMFFVEIFIS